MLSAISRVEEKGDAHIFKPNEDALDEMRTTVLRRERRTSGRNVWLTKMGPYMLTRRAASRALTELQG